NHAGFEQLSSVHQCVRTASLTLRKNRRLRVMRQLQPKLDLVKQGVFETFSSSRPLRVRNAEQDGNSPWWGGLCRNQTLSYGSGNEIGQLPQSFPPLWQEHSGTPQ